MGDFYDFVIAGAGPAGLTAGITAAKAGFRAIVLEKGERPGPHPRGEGIVPHAFLFELLGRDFFQKECFRMAGGQVFHSPGAQHQVRLPGKRDLCFFEWRRFIDRLAEKAAGLGVDIVCNAEVTRPLVTEPRRCTGLEYRDRTGKTEQVSGNAVLACDGHTSAVGSGLQVRYDLLNCPMVKCRAKEANIDIGKTPDLQFYLIGNGDLPFAQDFPPCVAYAFPIGGRNMEFGLMLRMSQARGMESVTIPSGQEIMQVWDHLKRDYPGFSSFFHGAGIVHEELTGMSNAGLVPDFVPVPGAVLIGDSAGFIDPFGSSGLYSGMMMADFWVRAVAEKIIELAGVETMDRHLVGLWSPACVRSMKKAFERSSIYRRVKVSYSKIGFFEWYIFRHLRTAGNINRRWKLISLMLKMP